MALTKTEWSTIAIIALIVISYLVVLSIRDDAYLKKLNPPEKVNTYFNEYAKMYPGEESVIKGNLEVVRQSYLLFPLSLPKRIVEYHNFDQVRDDPSLGVSVLIIVNTGDRTHHLDVGKAKIIHFDGEVKDGVSIKSGGILSPPSEDYL